MKENDRLDLSVHAAIDHLVVKLMKTNRFSRKEALTRLVAFAENDEEAPVFAQAAPHAMHEASQ